MLLCSDVWLIIGRIYVYRSKLLLSMLSKLFGAVSSKLPPGYGWLPSLLVTFVGYPSLRIRFPPIRLCCLKRTMSAVSSLVAWGSGVALRMLMVVPFFRGYTGLPTTMLKLFDSKEWFCDVGALGERFGTVVDTLSPAFWSVLLSWLSLMHWEFLRARCTIWLVPLFGAMPGLLKSSGYITGSSSCILIAAAILGLRKLIAIDGLTSSSCSSCYDLIVDSRCPSCYPPPELASCRGCVIGVF